MRKKSKSKPRGALYRGTSQQYPSSVGAGRNNRAQEGFVAGMKVEWLEAEAAATALAAARSQQRPVQPERAQLPRIPDATQALILLRQVNIIANTALRLSRDRSCPSMAYPENTCGVEVTEDDGDDRDERIALLRQTLNRIGWMADVVQRSLGGTGAFESAEDWMLPGG